MEQDKSQQATSEETVERENLEAVDATSNDQQTADADLAEETTPESEGSESANTHFQKQLEEEQNRYLRLQADFDNFRRRTRAEKEEVVKYSSLEVFKKLLPVIDNIERAMESTQSAQGVEGIVKGLELVVRQLHDVMEEEGLKAIESVGQPFNPDFHHAVMSTESSEHDEGIIIAEMQKGYILKDKVIRPAMVTVSS